MFIFHSMTDGVEQNQQEAWAYVKSICHVQRVHNNCGAFVHADNSGNGHISALYVLA